MVTHSWQESGKKKKKEKQQIKETQEEGDEGQREGDKGGVTKKGKRGAMRKSNAMGVKTGIKEEVEILIMIP